MPTKPPTIIDVELRRPLFQGIFSLLVNFCVKYTRVDNLLYFWLLKSILILVCGILFQSFLYVFDYAVKSVG